MKYLFIVLNLCLLIQSQAIDEGVEEAVELVDVRNDAIAIRWRLPSDVVNSTTTQRIIIAVVRSSMQTARSSTTAMVSSSTRSFTWSSLVGNTTYRVSVEAFNEDESIWYASNMATTSLASLAWLPRPTNLALIDKTNSSLEVSWTATIIRDSTHHAIINLHVINVYEFNAEATVSSKKFSFDVPVPKTSYVIKKLTPGSVYNITIQAGTSYGYGLMAWTVFSTLSSDADGFVLKQRGKTPNSISLSWPAKWLPYPNSKYTIRAKTLHSPDGIEKEIVNTGIAEGKASTEFIVRNLRPGSSYNVSISTDYMLTRKTSWGNQVKKKTAWSVMSTLTQGEYTVSDPRIVVETETAVSIVFQPLRHLGKVVYQIRWVPVDGSNAPNIEEFTEKQLQCPKFGCDWLCALIINLTRRPREFTFEIRAKVEGQWNKWSTVLRRPWNLLERQCSITPPPLEVLHIGDVEHQREVDLSSAFIAAADPWRYLIVVDSREYEVSAIDITKLSDKATSDYDHVPYYISGALSPEDVLKYHAFRLGDGRVYGGYLNYPLTSKESSPRWTLVPISQTEHEIMEPHIKTCGFTERGTFECDISVWDVVELIPWWLVTVFALLFTLVIFALCAICICLLKNCSGRKSRDGVQESSLLYYSNDTPTREYRKVEHREFGVAEMMERMKFIQED